MLHFRAGMCVTERPGSPSRPLASLGQSPGPEALAEEAWSAEGLRILHAAAILLSLCVFAQLHGLNGLRISKLFKGIGKPLFDLLDLLRQFFKALGIAIARR